MYCNYIAIFQIRQIMQLELWPELALDFQKMAIFPICQAKIWYNAISLNDSKFLLFKLTY